MEFQFLLHPMCEVKQKTNCHETSTSKINNQKGLGSLDVPI